MVNKLSPTLFARRAKVDPVTGCWLWTPATQSIVRAGGASWTLQALSWRVHFGALRSRGRPSAACGNPRCCCPGHLELLDAPRARRKETRPRHRKLSEADVLRVLTRSETSKDAAAALGVSRSHVARIRLGQRKALAAPHAPRAAPHAYGRLGRDRLPPRIMV